MTLKIQTLINQYLKTKTDEEGFSLILLCFLESLHYFGTTVSYS